MNEHAGPGEVFVCASCGRRSRDRWGLHKIHSGWDESCRAHAVLYREEDLIIDSKNGTVLGVKEGAAPISKVLH